MSQPDQEVVEVWYVASGTGRESGFTSQVEQAARDQFGHPIISNGSLRRLSGRMAKRLNGNLELLWDHYLDLMEKKFEMTDELREGEFSSALTDLFYEMRGTLDAIAILEYGHMFRHNPEHARDLVQRRAEIRYAKEAE